MYDKLLPAMSGCFLLTMHMLTLGRLRVVIARYAGLFSFNWNLSTLLQRKVRRVIARYAGLFSFNGGAKAKSGAGKGLLPAMPGCFLLTMFFSIVAIGEMPSYCPLCRAVFF